MHHKYIMVDQVSIQDKLKGLTGDKISKSISSLFWNTALFATFLLTQSYFFYARI